MREVWASDGSGEIIRFGRTPSIAGAETLRVERSARLWRRFHDTYTITALVDGGGVEWRRGRESNRADPGDLCFAQPGDLTLVTALPAPLTFVSLMIAASVMADAAADLGVRSGRPSWRKAQVRDEQLSRLVIGHHRTLEQSASASAAQAALAELMTLLFGHCVERRTSEAAPAPRANVLRARDYLVDNYSHRFRMGDVASAAGISRYHLARAFAAEFGVTPHTYLMQVRLAKAKALLADDVPSQRVAADTGFADQSHFTRHFRNTYGVTPMQYSNVARRGRPAPP